MQRPAIVVVTKAGMIRVMSQSQDQGWQEFKAEIENIGGPSELLTHAAMCPEKMADKSTSEQGHPSPLPNSNELTSPR